MRQFVYPMLMFMGAKKHKIGGMGASPMLAGCTQTCQAQLGCGELPDGDLERASAVASAPVSAGATAGGQAAAKPAAAL